MEKHRAIWVDITMSIAIIAVVLIVVTKKWEAGLLFAYLFLFLAMTVLTRPIRNMRYELIPFWSYMDYFNGTDKALLKQIIGNVLMFIPIGVLAGKWLGWKGTWIGVAFSCFIEITQLISRRGIFEFDDIIHNSLGSLLGVSLVMLTQRWRRENDF